VTPGLARALEAAREQGFLGDGPVEGHIEHAIGFATAVEDVLGVAPSAFLDMGSGGGVPGLVLAARWSEAEATLLDANRSRCRVLQAAAHDLGFEHRIRVLCLRAEEAGRDPGLRSSQPVVVARSFGAPAVTAECGGPLLQVGGLLVVAEPPGPVPTRGGQVGHPGRWPEEPLAELGLAPLRFWFDQAGYQVLRQLRPCPARYPRRVGIPEKRPLYRCANWST